jgi:hypothetical protein
MDGVGHPALTGVPANVNCGWVGKRDRGRWLTNVAYRETFVSHPLASLPLMPQLTFDGAPANP